MGVVAVVVVQTVMLLAPIVMLGLILAMWSMSTWLDGSGVGPIRAYCRIVAMAVASAVVAAWVVLALARSAVAPAAEGMYVMDLAPRCRLIQPGDIEQVTEIEECGAEWAMTPRQMRTVIRCTTSVVRVATWGGDVVGFLIYATPAVRDVVWLMSLVVRLDVLRLGVGSILMADVKRLAKLRRRPSKIVTEVGESNLTAQLFLRSMGFRCTRVVENMYPNGDAVYLMEREGEGAKP